MKLSIATIVGARPQFIKAAAVSRAIAGRDDIEEMLIHTGQHYDFEMSQVFFEELALPEPHHHLGVGSGPHGAQTGQMLRRIEEVLMEDRVALVLVYGDTNSTLAGALAAAKLNIPIAHVEAGLRAFRMDMPEEINRVVSDRLSRLLFAPSESAVANLAAEGIRAGVRQVGDVMYDVLRSASQLRRSEVLSDLDLMSGSYALATVHRAENTDDPSRLNSIFDALEKIASEGLPVIVPLHPRTRAALRDRTAGHGVRIVEPVSYLRMLELEREARVVLTDSGGVQKEAFWLGIPCVTLRDETEWVETVALGWNTLCGVDVDAIVAAALNERGDLVRPDVYGSGDAGIKVVEAMVEWRAQL